MGTASIPAYCQECQRLFPSGFSMGDGATNNTFIGIMSQCPKCKEPAPVVDGTFSVKDGLLKIVTAPNITYDMIRQFQAAVERAHKENKSAEALAEEVEKIDPEFAKIVREQTKTGLLPVSLLILSMALKQCTVSIDANVSVELDVNQLVDQIMQSTHSEVTEEQLLPQSRNSPCHCGSQKKYKHCHGKLNP